MSNGTECPKPIASVRNPIYLYLSQDYPSIFFLTRELCPDGNSNSSNIRLNIWRLNHWQPITKLLHLEDPTDSFSLAIETYFSSPRKDVFGRSLPVGLPSLEQTLPNRRICVQSHTLKIVWRPASGGEDAKLAFVEKGHIMLSYSTFCKHEAKGLRLSKTVCIDSCARMGARISSFKTSTFQSQVDRAADGAGFDGVPTLGVDLKRVAGFRMIHRLDGKSVTGLEGAVVELVVLTTGVRGLRCGLESKITPVMGPAKLERFRVLFANFEIDGSGMEGIESAPRIELGGFIKKIKPRFGVTWNAEERELCLFSDLKISTEGVANTGFFFRRFVVPKMAETFLVDVQVLFGADARKSGRRSQGEAAYFCEEVVDLEVEEEKEENSNKKESVGTLSGNGGVYATLNTSEVTLIGSEHSGSDSSDLQDEDVFSRTTSEFGLFAIQTASEITLVPHNHQRSLPVVAEKPGEKGVNENTAGSATVDWKTPVLQDSKYPAASVGPAGVRVDTAEIEESAGTSGSLGTVSIDQTNVPVFGSVTDTAEPQLMVRDVTSTDRYSNERQAGIEQGSRFSGVPGEADEALLGTAREGISCEGRGSKVQEGIVRRWFDRFRRGRENQ